MKDEGYKYWEGLLPTILYQVISIYQLITNGFISKSTIKQNKPDMQYLGNFQGTKIEGYNFLLYLVF
ncbi:hypothetical protein AM629_19180 [Photorhabdus heterorhabditis]|uniref:Uncharacterized protein n=1 Tax=Photorhabdus heterorhabditis TaxID=880156 RepID=A0ABR5K7Y8_9GAMM|nr:hypothetical protein AM629_19180 [Photorhabdus heterorhabditis]